MTEDPRNIYDRLLRERRADIAHWEERHRQLGYVRLGVVACAAVVVWSALAGRVSITWTFVPIVVFAALLVLGDRWMRFIERRRRAERYFEKALARLDGRWAGTGETGDRFNDPEHPYAQDLDLFGKGSVFELLSTARTHIGEDTLARWLLAPADPDTIRARQEAVNELRPRLDLREDLAVVAEAARTGVDPVSLASWGEAPALLGPGHLRLQIWFFTALGVLALAAALILALQSVGLMTQPNGILCRDFFLLVILINGTFYYRKRKPIAEVVGAVEEAAHELGLLTEVLRRLEKEQFQTPRLASLLASLRSESEPPSRRIARLDRIVELIDSRDNVFVRVLEIFIMWTPRHALAVEEWRRHSGSAVRLWLTAAGEMEALCSLASHAFEHPADPFPEFIAESGMLEAEAVGHPLLPEQRVVRNDMTIGGSRPHLLVVSGSNMSGKSTMLRTLGVNTVLAQAGAPVRARRLRLSPLAIGASIRLSDSLQGGVSRFYAEILRLRQILDLTSKPVPVLFLIDEFLNGTNSHDRRIGAEALVRRLVECGAIGLITTHDLALADIADVLGERAANVHFEDQISDGEIHFDYQMRPGIVRKSNAIELMRSVGLEI
ncbi:MAG TPA: hypothetical protein VKU19_30445 [Bryobacteraceae bacterium]|nr:hypothetical protein [Bryobacteraceae bacterium]